MMQVDSQKRKILFITPTTIFHRQGMGPQIPNKLVQSQIEPKISSYSHRKFLSSLNLL